MRTRQVRPFSSAAFVILLATLLASDVHVAKAHDFIKFLYSPYYGAGNPSRRWEPNTPHWGIDFLLRPERWDRVLAAADGTIEEVGWSNPACHDTSCTGSGLGLCIRIRHADINGHSMYSHYGHLSVARPTGQVLGGEWIGTSGNSGNSTGPHLHFEVTHTCTDFGTNVNTCSVSPDLADGTSLWLSGEWQGSTNNNPPSKAARRYVTLGTYGNDVIVDDTATNTSTFQKGCSFAGCPAWYRTNGLGYNNGGYFWTHENNLSPTYWAEWIPNLPSLANYEVLAWMPCGNNNTANPDFTVWSAYYYIERQGSPAFGPIKVDQLTLSRYDATEFRRGCNRWIGLGIYEFPAGTSSNLRMTDETDQTGVGQIFRIGVDAVKFSRVNIGPFEAEVPFKKTKKTDTNGNQHEWIAYTNGLYGGNYISTRPNTGANINTDIETYSPKIRFNVIFPTAGTYHVWIRRYATNGSDDSVHAGILSQVSLDADKITCTQWSQSQWYWCKSTADGPPATIQVTQAGASVFELWMREDNFNVDKIVLSKDANHNEQTTPTNEVPFIFPGDNTEPEVDP